MLTIFFSFAYGHLNYFISAWCRTNFWLLDSLQRCCNKILRIIFFRDSRSNCDHIPGVHKVRVHFKKIITLIVFAIEIICKKDLKEENRYFLRFY